MNQKFRIFTFFLLLRFLVLGLSTRELFLASITNSFTDISNQKGRNLSKTERTITWKNELVKTESYYLLVVVRTGKVAQGFRRVPRMSETRNWTEERDVKADIRDTIREASKVEKLPKRLMMLSAEFNRTPSVQIWNGFYNRKLQNISSDFISSCGKKYLPTPFCPVMK